MVTDAGAAGDGRQGRDRKARVEAERRMRTGAEHGRAAASWMSHGGDDGKRSNESSEQCRRERLQPGLHQPPLLPLQGRRQALMLPAASPCRRALDVAAMAHSGSLGFWRKKFHPSSNITHEAE